MAPKSYVFLKKSGSFLIFAERGLMTIMPYVLDPEEEQKHFKKCSNYGVDIKTKTMIIRIQGIIPITIRN